MLSRLLAPLESLGWGGWGVSQQIHGHPITPASSGQG